MTADEDEDPATLAATVAVCPRPLLVGLDVDGVLAPIVAHAAHARLLPGVHEAVTEIARHTPVAVVSGRPIHDLARFDLPENVEVFGTHGLERRGHPAVELDDLERRRYGRLHEIATAAAEQAGPGAWVELKPAGVVLHVREAPPHTARPAAEGAYRDATAVAGGHVKLGKSVVEMLARPATKASAIATLRAERAAAAVLYVGDDHTDEEVFVTLQPADVSVRVGPGTTAARHRLADPPAVLTFLRVLTASLLQAHPDATAR